MATITIQIPAKTWKQISTSKTDYSLPGQSSVWVKEADTLPVDLTNIVKLNPGTTKTFTPKSGATTLYIYSDIATSVSLTNPEISDTSEVDQISDPLDFYLSREIANTNLSNDIVILNQTTYLQVQETSSVTVDDATGAAAGLWIELWEGLLKYQGEIQSVVGNVINLYMPIGLPFTTAAYVCICDIDQNKDFTVATGIGPQIYSIDPPPIFTGNFHQNRFMITMLHTAESDSSTYGDIQGGLPMGIVVSGRGTLFANETGLPLPLVLYNNLLDIKLNGDWKQTAYDVTYEPKSGNPASSTYYGTTIRKTFNGKDKSGVAIPVRSDRNEATRALCRDNMSSLILHRIKSIGHLVD